MVEYKLDNYDAILAIYASDEHVPKLMTIVNDFSIKNNHIKIYPIKPQDGGYYFAYKGDLRYAFKLLDNIFENGAHGVYYEKK